MARSVATLATGTLFLIVVAGMLVWLTVGCPPGDDDGDGNGDTSNGNGPIDLNLANAQPAPNAADWTDAHSQRVHKLCGSCHADPAPDVLPRYRWETLIPTMGTMPVPADVTQPTADDLVLAMAYYDRRAPEALPVTPVTSDTAGAERFVIEHFTPGGGLAGAPPAVTHVQFARLSDPVRQDLFICDTRVKQLPEEKDGILFLLAPWATGELRTIRVLASGLNRPVHLDITDLDGDGRKDIACASIGEVNPSNDVSGAVSLLMQDERGAFTTRQPLADVGRPADVRAADLDGDGDKDLVVGLFGWRGPGALIVLENRNVDWRFPRFVTHELDDRDGWIHTEITDLDGDGRLDIVALLSQEHEQVLAYMNRGDLRFETKVLFAANTPTFGFSGMSLVDLDRDGDQDVLLSNGDTLDDDILKPYHGVRWLENKGKLEFEHHEIAFMDGCERAVAGDVDGDGDLDIVAVAWLPQVSADVWRERNLDSVVWIENLSSDGATARSWAVHSLEKHRPLHPTADVADYDANGKLDIAVGNYVWIAPGGEAATEAEYITLFTAR